MWTGLTPQPDSYFGFVYRITNKETGQFYIGRKYYYKTKKLPPLKGRTNKRIQVTDSDWKDYWGSSTELTADIERLGKDNFTREILFQGQKGEVNYMEAKYQFDLNVLVNDKSYNKQIHVRINHIAVRHLNQYEKEL